MFGSISELIVRRVRWILTIGWLLLIASLFFDPVSAWLTLPERSFSPFRLDPSVCVQLQGRCLEEAPYAVGAPIFWGAIVPAAIFILLVFGHELWRRICPLSFLSQLPRALNSQRRIKRTDKRGKVRYELAKVDKDSWLARNHIYLQMGLFYAGLCARILFVNSERSVLGLFLLGTIVFAVGVGYYYGGKSWCNYFCPMSPVQKVYAEPGGLFASQAHTAGGGITQSMCRTIDPKKGKEISACVSCQTPCIDIDSERSYWENIAKPDRKLLYYGYFGLMVGYFGYYYLYAGNWAYYMTGVWAHQENQLSTLFDPGFYLFGTPIAIPKLAAVPITLGLSALVSIAIGLWLEKAYKSLTNRIRPLDRDTLQHHIFTLYTYLSFNFFFIFGGRGFINLLPSSVVHMFEATTIVLSTIWLLKTLPRNPDKYLRERLSDRFRKQLVKLELDVERLLDRRSLDDLNPDEVYVLTKVLPDFTQEKRLVAYKGVLSETLAEGHFDSTRTQNMLAQMRQQLEIDDRKHREILSELGLESITSPDMSPKPSKQEDLMRAVGYRQALSRVQRMQLRQQGDNSESLDRLSPLDPSYEIASGHRQRFERSSGSNKESYKKIEILLQQLRILAKRYQVLEQISLPNHGGAVALLEATLERKERQLVTGLFQHLAAAANATTSLTGIARSVSSLAPRVVRAVLSELPPNLREHLPKQFISDIEQLTAAPIANQLPSTEMGPNAIAKSLKQFCEDLDPFTQAVGMYLLSEIDFRSSQEVAHQLKENSTKLNRIVSDMVETLLEQEAANSCSLTSCPTIFREVEKLICLKNSDFFGDIQSETAIELSYLSRVLVHAKGEEVVGADAAKRELLLLLDGEATIEMRWSDDKVESRPFVPGKAIDELEVFGNPSQTGRITAVVDGTRVMAVPVDAFDDLMDSDLDFANSVVNLERSRLKQLL